MGLANLRLTVGRGSLRSISQPFFSIFSNFFYLTNLFLEIFSSTNFFTWKIILTHKKCLNLFFSENDKKNFINEKKNSREIDRREPLPTVNRKLARPRAIVGSEHVDLTALQSFRWPPQYPTILIGTLSPGEGYECSIACDFPFSRKFLQDFLFSECYSLHTCIAYFR